MQIIFTKYPAHYVENATFGRKMMSTFEVYSKKEYTMTCQRYLILSKYFLLQTNIVRTKHMNQMSFEDKINILRRIFACSYSIIHFGCKLFHLIVVIQYFDDNTY